jgi:hypothetical protein
MAITAGQGAVRYRGPELPLLRLLMNGRTPMPNISLFAVATAVIATGFGVWVFAVAAAVILAG